MGNRQKVGEVMGAGKTGAEGFQNTIGGRANKIKISDEQFGKKVGKHAEDYGLAPGDPASRDFIKNKINDIYNYPTEIREGTFRGQGDANSRGNVKFYIQGNDVVVTDMNDNFVTILKDGINNPSVMSRTKIWP